ncbi:MAG: hypothetical protein WCN81_00135 [Actinomycetes bacterium]
MRVLFTQFGNLQFASAEGLTSYRHEAGEIVDLPEHVGAMFIKTGVAVPAPAEPRNATKPMGEAADKPRGRSRRNG